MVVISDQITLTHVVDVFKTIYYYKKQDASLNPPVKPASYSVPDPSAELTPPTGWTKTEPSYTAGETSILYVTVCTVYSDGDVEFSDVTVSSSFEAAKQAYAAASSASGNAASAMETANGKNKIYYTNNKASITGATVGDLCFETTTVNGVTGYNLWEYKPTTTASTNPWEKATLGPGVMTARSIFANDINVDNLGAINAKMGFVTIGGALDSSSKPVNGKITITDTTGAEIGHWDQAGILAKAGEIGGWNVASNTLSNEVTVSGTTYKAGLQSMGSSTDTTRLAFYVQTTTGGTTTQPFKVNYNGKMWATDAVISGDITATAGSIGGWNIESEAISKVTADTNYRVRLQAPSSPTTDSNALRIDQKINGNWTNLLALTYGGAIAATKGTIAGWSLSSTALYRTSSTFGAANGLYFGSDGLSLADKFKVTSAGVLTATRGEIGGFTIESTRIYCPAISGTKTYRANMQAMGSTVDVGKLAFYIAIDEGNTTEYPFRVNYQGKLWATNAVISGDITASSGEIGGFEIDSSSIHTKNTTSTTTTANAFYLSSSTFNRAIAGYTINNLKMAIGDGFAIDREGSVYIGRWANLVIQNVASSTELAGGYWINDYTYANVGGLTGLVYKNSSGSITGRALELRSRDGSDLNIISVNNISITGSRPTASWVNSIALPALHVTPSGTDGAICGMTMKTNGGYVGLCTHPSSDNDNKLYVKYITNDNYNNRVNTTVRASVDCNITGHADGDLATTGGTLSGGLGINKTSGQDGNAGFWANTAGNVYLTGGTNAGGTIYFYYNKATSSTSYIQEVSSGALKTNANFTSTKGIYAGGKGTSSDGTTGSILSTGGHLYMQATSGSHIYFYYGSATSPTSQIYESTSGGIHISADLRVPSIWETTTTSSASVNIVDNNGLLRRYSSSSQRYKHDISRLIDYKKILEIPVVSFVYNDEYLGEGDQREGKHIPGFIAEDIERLYPIAVDIRDGKAEDWNAKIIIPPMLAIEQEHEKRITMLEHENQKLKAELEALKGAAK